MPQPSRLLRLGLVGLCVALVLPQLLPGVNPSYLIVVAIAAGAALLVARTEDAGDRITSLNLFVWALLCRCLAVTVCYALSTREGGLPGGGENNVNSRGLASSRLVLSISTFIRCWRWAATTSRTTICSPQPSATCTRLVRAAGHELRIHRARGPAEIYGIGRLTLPVGGAVPGPRGCTAPLAHQSCRERSPEGSLDHLRNHIPDLGHRKADARTQRLGSGRIFFCRSGDCALPEDRPVLFRSRISSWLSSRRPRS